MIHEKKNTLHHRRRRQYRYQQQQKQQQQQQVHNLLPHEQQYEILNKEIQTRNIRDSLKITIQIFCTKTYLRRNCNYVRRMKEELMHRWIYLSTKTTQKRRKKTTRASSFVAFRVPEVIVKWMLLVCLLLANVGKPNEKLNWFVMADQNAALAKNAKYQSEDYSKFGMLEVTNSCRENRHRPQLTVKNVYMVCDSPNAYYYGSNSYRNSSTCVYGDTAMVNIEFKIKKDFTGASSVKMILDSGIYDNWEQVLLIQDLCSSSGLVRMNDDNYTCPHPGNYELYTSYIVPAQQDVDLRYTPDIKLKFLSKKGYQLGCALTGTMAMRSLSNAKEKVGIFLMGTCLMMFFSIFGFLLILSYRKKNRFQKEVEDRRSVGFHLHSASADACKTNLNSLGAIGKRTFNNNSKISDSKTSNSETASTTIQRGLIDNG